MRRAAEGPTVDQRTLVERARGGDRDAFAVLARAAAARLDAAARLILRDRELARDAVQEALIRAWRDLPGLRIQFSPDGTKLLIVHAAAGKAWLADVATGDYESVALGDDEWVSWQRRAP
jgi:DNA-directed RNA polymerase specialized sigma24 family protein